MGVGHISDSHNSDSHISDRIWGFFEYRHISDTCTAYLRHAVGVGDVQSPEFLCRRYAGCCFLVSEICRMYPFICRRCDLPQEMRNCHTSSYKQTCQIALPNPWGVSCFQSLA